jgi:hypothetical protein
VICRTTIDGKEIYLDASKPGMGFGKLDYQCYNGHARIINAEATAIDLDPATVKEVKNTIVFIINDEKGNLIGSIQQTPGYFESLHLRGLIKEKGKEQLVNDIKKNLGEDVVVSNVRVDSLKRYEEPVFIAYDIDLKSEKDDIIYFNPMIGEGMKENPFKSAERFYPVEMPYAVDETYSLQMEIPTGYVVDELPKQTILKINEEEDATFEYRISTSGSNISFRTRLVIKKAFFLPEDYESLREFYALIVKKQNEQIVFKKKSIP